MSGQGGRIRFANSWLDDIASLLVRTHPRAAQYLEQAPALAVMAHGKFSSHITYGELDRFAASVGREPKLADLLAAFGLRAPLRRLSPHTLHPKDGPVLRQLSRLDASTLSQATPSDSQRVWLDAIDKWLRLMPRSKAARGAFSVGWIARRLTEDMGRFEQVDALIDFVGRGNGVINPLWSWKRAMEEVAAWHRRINDDRAIARSIADAKRRADFDKVICRAPVPDEAACDGYDFVALRTARKLREEGQALHHCVASYAADVRRGQCAVISVRRDGVNIATLQLSAAGTVAQLKAHCNAAPPDQIRAACETYALLNWRPEPEAEVA